MLTPPLIVVAPRSAAAECASLDRARRRLRLARWPRATSVVTKPGYGIVADCLANRVAVLFTDRGPFREYDVLAEALPRLGRARYVPRADVLAGQLGPHLDALARASTRSWTSTLDGRRRRRRRRVLGAAQAQPLATSVTCSRTWHTVARAAEPTRLGRAARSTDDRYSPRRPARLGRLPSATSRAPAGQLPSSCGCCCWPARACVMQLGWVIVWTLSYRLTHGNDFTYTYLVSQTGIWEKLHDLLRARQHAGARPRGPDGPDRLDIIVNALVLGVHGRRRRLPRRRSCCSISGVAAVRGAALVVLSLFELRLPGHALPDAGPLHHRHLLLRDVRPDLGGLQPEPVHLSAELLSRTTAADNWIHPIWCDQPSVYGPLWTDLGWLMARLMAPLDGSASRCRRHVLQSA